LPGWDKAPENAELTIVFTFIENMEKFEKLLEEEEDFPLKDMIYLYQTQVSKPTVP
jgi:hypothetical protein